MLLGRQVSGEEFSAAGQRIMARLMRLHDGNHDGLLGRQEGSLALKAIGLSERDVYASLPLLDFSRDGELQPEEVDNLRREPLCCPHACHLLPHTRWL